MDFTFLGTSAATSTKARNVTALALQQGSPRNWYLIDCGEGTQHQLLHSRHSLHQLRAIFITHVHGDHSFGLPGLLASASMNGRTEPLPIIAPAPLKAFIETALGNTDSALSFEIDFIESGDADLTWEDENVHVATVALSHRVPCTAFVFTEKNLEKKLLTDRLEAEGIAAGPIWGRLQQGEDVALEGGRVLHSADYTTTLRQPRKVIVGGDNDTPELLRDACQGAQLLIHETTYTQAVSDRVGPWPQHSSAAQVGQFAESAGLPNLIVTHFSSRYQFSSQNAPLIDEIGDEVKTFYRGNLFLARDFAEYRLDRDLMLTPLSGE